MNDGLETFCIAFWHLVECVPGEEAYHFHKPLGQGQVPISTKAGSYSSALPLEVRILQGIFG